jgi:hypothetical protein
VLLLVAPRLVLMLFIQVLTSPSFVLLLLTPCLALLLLASRLVLQVLLVGVLYFPPFLPYASWSLECKVKKREKVRFFKNFVYSITFFCFVLMFLALFSLVFFSNF